MYLSLDTETGGLELKNSLLTLGLVLANDNFEVIDSINFMIKPNYGNYLLTAQGMEVNQINLVEHDKVAQTEKEAGTLLYNLLKKWSNDGKDKLKPIGKQMAGDIAQIFDKLITRATWEQFVSYRHIEVSAIAMFMMDVGLIPEMKGSLSDLAKHYNIPTEGLHNSLVDAMMTLRVYEAMVKTSKGAIK